MPTPDVFSFLGPLMFLGFTGFAVLMLWSLFWKSTALFEAAKRNEKWWFAVLLVLNTCGIVEIIYLFLVAKSGVKKSALWGSPWSMGNTDSTKQETTPPAPPSQIA